MIGQTAAFTAALVAALADNPQGGLDGGIRRGIAAARRLNQLGFRVNNDSRPDYPIGAQQPLPGHSPPVVLAIDPFAGDVFVFRAKRAAHAK
jgi:hypothetical protein